MKKFYSFILSLALIAGLAVPLIATPSLHAASNAEALCQGSGGTWKVDDKNPSGGVCSSADGRTVPGTLQQVTDVLIFIVGAIAVIMIIIGGLRYVLSAGDQAALSSAKNTILYAIIGLVVAFTAYAIVHFIFAAFNIK